MTCDVITFPTPKLRDRPPILKVMYSANNFLFNAKFNCEF